jgi:hypothetical protein
MARETTAPRKTFNEAVSDLRAQSFDVQEVPGVANRIEVRKYGCGAMLARSEAGAVSYFAGPGCIVAGEIAVLVDRGYQKFLTTSQLRIAATADRLRALYSFQEELRAATGKADFYNLALGTVSDVYLYDRVKGRELEPPTDPVAH